MVLVIAALGTSLALSSFRAISYSLVVHASPVAQDPISIRSVYTTDENQQSKTLFARGDKFNAYVDVDNIGRKEIAIDVRVEIFTRDGWPSSLSVDQSFHEDKMPVGLSQYHYPETIPADAGSGSYILKITVTLSGSTHPGHWREGGFTVQ